MPNDWYRRFYGYKSIRDPQTGAIIETAQSGGGPSLVKDQHPARPTDRSGRCRRALGRRADVSPARSGSAWPDDERRDRAFGLWLSCHTQEEIAAELDMAQRTVADMVADLAKSENFPNPLSCGAVSGLQRDAVQRVEAPHRGDRRSASARYVIAQVGQPRYPLTAAARGDRAQSWHAVASCTTASQCAGLDGTIRRRLMRTHAATPSWTVSRSVAIKCCRSRRAISGDPLKTRRTHPGHNCAKEITEYAEWEQAMRFTFKGPEADLIHQTCHALRRLAAAHWGAPARDARRRRGRAAGVPRGGRERRPRGPRLTRERIAAARDRGCRRKAAMRGYLSA